MPTIKIRRLRDAAITALMLLSALWGVVLLGVALVYGLSFVRPFIPFL
jgi:hypothetical protein